MVRIYEKPGEPTANVAGMHLVKSNNPIHISSPYTARAMATMQEATKVTAPKPVQPLPEGIKGGPRAIPARSVGKARKAPLWLTQEPITSEADGRAVEREGVIVPTEYVTLPIAGANGRPLVERPAPGKAPTAFRIWAAGENQIDGQPSIVFSERSARALIREQGDRGRLYSFDYDHRSMMPDASPQAGKAAGWHKLGLRPSNGGFELWAIECQWTNEAREGLEASTPEWKYFSPAYIRDEETNEVMSYSNCALTNNPLTRGIPALASRVQKRGKPGGLAFARAAVAITALRAKAQRRSGMKTVKMAKEVEDMNSQVRMLQARLTVLELASAARAKARKPERPWLGSFEERLANVTANTLNAIPRGRRAGSLSEVLPFLTGGNSANEGGR